MKRLIIWCLLLLLFGQTAHAQQPVTLANPIAYIAADLNVYLTDGTASYPLTHDAGLDEHGLGVYYAQPRWSPDGRLVFIRYATTEPYQTLMLAASGASPMSLPAFDSGFSLESSVIAWSPDGTRLAVIASDGGGHRGVFAISIPGDQVKSVARIVGGGIGEAGGNDPAMYLAARESGNDALRDQYSLTWTEAGIFFSPAANSGGVRLVTPEGRLLWSDDSHFGVVASPDGTRIAAIGFDGTAATLSATDGTPSPLGLPGGAVPRAWEGNSLLYTRRDDVKSVAGNFDSAAGQQVFDGEWGFPADDSALSLSVWISEDEGGVTYETRGYDFGVVRPVGEHRTVVSLVTSNFEAVTALNHDAAPDSVKDLLAHPVIYVFDDNSNQPVFTLAGGQPDGIPGDFTVISPG
jgi:WD40 repeat protein